MYSEKRRVLAFVLAMLLIFTSGASFVLAEGEMEQGELSGEGLCEHHPVHTPECGYQEPDEGSPCAHEHTEECYVLDENGEQVLNCGHVHDESCGYREAETGAPCGYHCEICTGEDTEQPAEEISISQWTWNDERGVLSEEDGGWVLDMEDSAAVDREDLYSMLPTEITAQVQLPEGEPEVTEKPEEPAEEADSEEEPGTEVTDFGEEPVEMFLEDGESDWDSEADSGTEMETSTEEIGTRESEEEQETAESGAGGTADDSTSGAEIKTENLEIAWDIEDFPEDGAQEGNYVLNAALPEGYELTDGAGTLQVTLRLGEAQVYTKLPEGEIPYSNHTVKGISPVGTTINLFDYWLEEQTKADDKRPNNYQNLGINENHALLFGNDQQNLAVEQVRGEWNHWTGKKPINAKWPYSNIVEKKLVDGYPIMNGEDVLKYYGEGYPRGESLSYLFNPNYKQEGKATYKNVQGLLQIDEENYYYYDCTQNYAVYYDDTRSFALYDAPAVKPGGAKNGQFFPFNAADQVLEEQGGQLVAKDVNVKNALLNHYFGMTMTTRFIQQHGGHTKPDKAQPVTYEFSGDDDVWVFIDDVLVGDLGGIHNAASLKIDFSTGEIFINDNPDGTLREKFESAGVNGKFADGSNTFRDDTYHTLKFYYLERGHSDSNMSLKFNLVTIPESSVIKVDQTGEEIKGAGFRLYAANEEYEYNEQDLIATGVTDENGEFIFMKDDAILGLEDIYQEGKVSRLVLMESDTPEGYRSMKEYRFYFRKSGNNLVLLSANPWETGAYASSNVTVQADEEISLVGKSQEINLKNGTMFAVVLQYQGEDSSGMENPNNWHAVSGEPIAGWKVTEDTGMDGILTAAKENQHPFIVTPDGAYTTTVQDLPGDIMSYYYMLSDDEKSQAKYTIGYFYTNANSIDGATKDNTSRVDSDEFERLFSVNLYVPNVKNNLYVQKLDENGTPISAAKESGEATFALYKVDEFLADGNYAPTESALERTVTTSDMKQEEGAPFDLTGGAMFSGIPLGKYYLVEIEAPEGYKRSETSIPVIVDNTGVYANAGTEDDGIAVERGVGSIVRSMIQFAADDKVDATLHDIKVGQETAEDYYQEESWKRSNEAEDLHLQYLNGSENLEYGPVDGKGTTTWRNEVGWSRLVIQQCLLHGNKGSYKQELGDQNLIELFSRTVIVSVENQTLGNLKVSKEVVGPAGEGQEFTFEITLTDKDGKSLEGSYPAQKTGNTDGNSAIENVSDGSQVTLQGGESLLVEELPAGTKYVVKEVKGNSDNYSTVVSVDGSVQEGDEVSGEIPKNDTSQVAFKNIFLKPAQVELKGRKTLIGRNLRPEDSFKFQLTGGNDETKKAIEAGIVKIPENSIQVQWKGTDRQQEFPLGSIEILEEGIYCFHVNEKLPEGVTQENPVGIDGIRYDSHTAEIIVTVKANEEETELTSTVTYDNSTAIAEEDKNANLAAFTNSLTGKFSFLKTDGEESPLAGAEFVLYELVCTKTSHDHDKRLQVDAQGNLVSNSENAGCWEKISIQTSAADTGLVEFKNLSSEALEYRLVEYQAPDGYVLPDGQWKVTYDKDSGSFQVADAKKKLGNPAAFEKIKGKNASYQVRNYRPGELPVSGSRGTKVFLFIGGALMMAGGFWYLRIRLRRARS